MTDGVAFHQRIDQQYSALDEDEQRRFDEMVGRLQRGGMDAIPPSNRKVASGDRVGTSQKLWIVRLSSDLRAVVEEAEETLTVREIAQKGRIRFYRDVGANGGETLDVTLDVDENTVPDDLPPRTRQMLEDLGPATGSLDLDPDTQAWLDAAHEKHR